MTKYEKFESIWSEKHGPLVKEYRFALDIVGRGPNLRERLKSAGLQDWRLDYSIPELKIYLEVHGFGFSHQGNQGFLRDMKKHNCLVLNGWRGLYLPSGTVSRHPEYAVEQLENLVSLVKEENERKRID